MNERIAIIGAGALGSAMHDLLSRAGKAAALWDVDASKLPEPRELGDVVGGAELVLLCIPTASIRAAAQLLAPHVRGDAIIISLSKGLDRGSGQTVDALLAEAFPRHAIGLLSGPMLAAELQSGKLGAGVLATTDHAVFDRVAGYFRTSNLIVEYSSDLRGVAWCGVLKNVYAIGLGLATGLELGENARGWLMSHALGEMAQLLPRLGGQPDTLFTVAGVGDAVATALSATSRNHQYGLALARGETPTYQAEGALALAQVTVHVQSLDMLPFLAAIADVVQHNADPRAAFASFQVRTTT